MLALVIVILAGFSLYFLMKPPKSIQNVLAAGDKTAPESYLRSYKISRIVAFKPHEKFSK